MLYRCPLICSLFICLLMACDENDSVQQLSLYSFAFGEGQVIPRTHTCLGEGTSPVIFIENVPSHTAQFALVLEAVDLEEGPFTHWIIWGISPANGYIPDNVPAGDYIVGDFRQGQADDYTIGYSPICPPSGNLYQYDFIAYALDEADIPALSGAVNRREFDTAIKKHIVGKGVLSGFYER